MGGKSWMIQSLIISASVLFHYGIFKLFQAKLVNGCIFPSSIRRYLTILNIIVNTISAFSFLIGRSLAGAELSMLPVLSYILMGGTSLTAFWLIVFDIFAYIEKRFRLWSPSIPSRRNFLALIISLTLCGFGIIEAFKMPVIKEVEVTLEKLPISWDGTRIVQISDIHLGPTVGRKQLYQIVNMVNSLEPDIVAITGDLIDGNPKSIISLIEPLSKLKSKYGSFYVTGNHEYIHGDPSDWIHLLNDVGVRPLRNEFITLENTIQIAGVEDWTAYFSGNSLIFPDVSRAIIGRNINLPMILLAHQPKHIFQSSEAKIDLQLSGHTHGGQMLPFQLPAYLFNPYLYGLHQHNPNTVIYVSRGTRYWGPPMRLFAPSEITSITLRSPSSSS